MNQIVLDSINKLQNGNVSVQFFDNAGRKTPVLSISDSEFEEMKRIILMELKK